MKKEHKKIAEVAALAGTIMLEAHAESYRVEDTVRRILYTSNLDTTEVVSTTTGLFITLDDSTSENDGITLIRRIKNRSNQLNKIYQVNNVSRQLTKGALTVDEAHNKLLSIEMSEYSDFSKDVATILVVMSFAVLGGGSIWDVTFSIITGMIVAYARILRQLLDLNRFIYGVATTFLTAFVANLFATILPIPISSDTVIIASLIPLYPGTAFTNGVRDVLKGDYVSGVARITDAIVTAVSLAIGVAFGLYVYQEVINWIL